MNAVPERSYAKANRELIQSFGRYMEARGNSSETRRSYLRAITELVEAIGSQSVLNIERRDIRMLFTKWQRNGLKANSGRLYVCAFRAFFKFVQVAGLTRHNPMLLMGYPKVPTRIPVVLTTEEVIKLINVAENPFEKAAVEVLYSTGVRVSEFVKLRLEDIDWDSRSIRVHKGKGGKDRVVLFGSEAELAMRQYQQWRPSKHGYLFEAPAQTGQIVRHDWIGHIKSGSWYAKLYIKGVPRKISIGSVTDLPTKEDARDQFNRIVQHIPGFTPVGARPYSSRAIGLLLSRLAHRAGIARVHPHALRRAMASHMLESGANLRVLQDLLGHERLNTTMRYTYLTTEHVRKVYEKGHPHAKGGADHDEQ